MMQDDFNPDVLMDQMARFLGLTIEPAYRAGVAQHLQSARKIAVLLLAFELDDEAEPAPVFKP